METNENKSKCPHRQYHIDLDIHYCDKTDKICKTHDKCVCKESE